MDHIPAETNPFLSEIFLGSWLTHFSKDQGLVQLSVFPDLKFVKRTGSRGYYNAGGIQTKGITFTMTSKKGRPLENKVLVIFDVPSTLELDPDMLLQNHLKVLTSRQYPGYLCNFKGYDSLESYLKRVISSNSRAKLRYYGRKLDTMPGIRYQMHLSEISRDTYESLFQMFRLLLQQRFSQKKEYNNNLDPEEWEFYREVTYPLMREGKAGLFVTYHGDKPIALNLLFVQGNRLIDTIRVFDISYADKRVGNLSVLALMRWCFQNGFESLNFSKGDFEYKRRWSNSPYFFNYHIFYDASSPSARIYALSVFWKFQIKQFLRSLGVDQLFNQIKYYRQSRTLNSDENV
jgi:hypothetical protein